MYVMGLSSVDDDLEMKEEEVIQLKDDSRDYRNNLMTENVGIKGFDLEPEFDFYPIQHPTEPSHEDRPVQCPMPHSSHLISDERMQDDRLSDRIKDERMQDDWLSDRIQDERMQDDRLSDRKRPEAKMLLHKKNNELKGIDPPVRMVRKRHHDHTNIIIPLLQTPPVHPHLHQKDG